MTIRFAKRALLAALVGITGGLTGLLPLPAAAQQAAPAPIRVIEKAAAPPEKGKMVFGKAINKICDVQTISCGQTVSGSLSNQDCVLTDGSYVDYYEFPGTTGQSITATMRSTSVNSYLALLDPQDEDVQENNNGAGGNDARISFQLDRNGNWAVAAGSFSPHETGPYTLTLTCSGQQATPPAAPTNLQATAVSSNEIDLSWHDNSSDETGFIIEAIINGSFQQIGTVNGNVTAAQIVNLTPQTSYTFRVRARNANGTSAPSNQVTATTSAGGGGGGDFLTSAAFPNFRFRVRIFNTATPLAGRKESDCIPETLCVSGAIPGRSEVFVRIVGPRPNGYLWPTIVRFTPSRVEVDIQQISTGITKTYVLPAVPPDSDELSGLQDRTGFLP
ncbi:MAG: fibronectin type III domain-containing protein [Thermoanaerobaculia bacterium]